MKIKLLNNIYVAGKKVSAGDAIELIDSKAHALIKQCHAVKVEPVSLKKQKAVEDVALSN